jgi:hypothetical protein
MVVSLMPLLLLSACSSALRASASVTSEQVPIDVWLLRSHGNHRVVIRRVCNAEHCYTRGTLETLSKNGAAHPVHLIQIKELEEYWWSFVTEVTPSTYPHEYLDITAVDTHGTNAGFTLRIRPAKEGSYTAEMLEFRSGADVGR